MEKIIIWSIAAYGMSTIIVYGSIFDGMRYYIKAIGEDGLLPGSSICKFISKLITCMLCTSTWVGFFFSLCFGGLVTQFGIHWILGIFLDGMFTAGIVWALNGFIEFFEENRIKK